MKLSLPLLLILLTTPTALAADLRALPADVPLHGPRASQQLLVVEADGPQTVADRTGTATFTSSNPAVATVDARGVVRMAGDGEATVTATVGGCSAVAHVRVTGARTPVNWSFRNDVVPLMTKIGCNSGGCHGALAGKGGLKLSLRGYDPESDHFVLTRQALARRVDRQDPDRSLMILKPTRQVPHGGGRRFRASSAEAHLLREWIAAGAVGPTASDPRLVRVEVFPTAAVARLKDRLRVVVRAWYSDGRAKDVTEWARFSSSEDQVATVDDAGNVTVAGAGVAAINVAFGSRVAAVPVSVPFANPVDPRLFARAEKHNFIDELVLKQLAALRLPPSGLCTDREFIRRAFLDAAGTLPTPAEVERFVADRDPGKRSKLVDALLQRPEFTDYWAYKWCDLLLVSSRKLPQADVWAFYRFVRQAVADNKPWDRFAHDVLTASGSTLRNGAANYFVLHQDVSDRTESTAVTFLGTSVTCARCHNHPLEKWTQDQYWALANLFARVSLKNGDRPGEVIVQEQPAGDVPHPRRGVAMPPAPLDGKPLPLDSPVNRRRYFADWLTRLDNPYFAKALVNRVWKNFLGRGLVEAEDDLRATNPPTNRELFDALAADFVKHGYDVRHLIRAIMLSATYQRSSQTLPSNVADDRFYSHYLVRRLSAEVILDAYSQVTGVPTPFNEVSVGVTGGTQKSGDYPLGTRALQLPDAQVVSHFLDAFGRPERGLTCSCERTQDATVTQALHLNNGQTLNDKLRSPKSRVAQWLTEKPAPAEAVRRLYRLALGRGPTDAELRKFKTILAAVPNDPTQRREALEDLFWAVLTSREFLFNH